MADKKPRRTGPVTVSSADDTVRVTDGGGRVAWLGDIGSYRDDWREWLSGSFRRKRKAPLSGGLYIGDAGSEYEGWSVARVTDPFTLGRIEAAARRDRAGGGPGDGQV